jgi:SnoaL-like protein
MTAHPAPEVFAAMLHAVDDLDWDAARASLAAQVAIDYTSLWGGDPSTMAADELLDQWRALAPGFDATQHLLGPFVLTSADEQTVTSTVNIRAYHHVIEESAATTWLVVGRYTVTLTRESDGW